MEGNGALSVANQAAAHQTANVLPSVARMKGASAVAFDSGSHMWLNVYAYFKFQKGSARSSEPDAGCHVHVARVRHKAAQVPGEILLLETVGKMADQCVYVLSWRLALDLHGSLSCNGLTVRISVR